MRHFLRFDVLRPGLTVFLSAALVSAAVPTARAEEARVHTVQSEADLKQRADALLKNMASGGFEASYESVEKASTANGVVINNLKFTTKEKIEITVERLEVREFDWSKPEASKVADFSMRKVVFALDAIDKENELKLGSDKITLNVDMKWRLDDAGDQLDLSTLVLDFVDIAELRIAMKLTGLPTLAELKGVAGENGKGETKDPDEAEAMKVFAKLTLVGATISLKDKSLVQRLVATRAKAKQVSEQAAKAEILAELGEEKLTADDDATREALDVVIKFVTNPGTLEIVAEPPAPANLVAAFAALMSSPASMKQMLGLKIAAR
jgi:hypothetical protein